MSLPSTDFRLNRQQLGIKIGDVNTDRSISIKVGDINERTHLMASSQDIFDVAIQRLGGIEDIFEDIIEFNNGLNINTELKVTDKIFVNTNNTTEFNTKNRLKSINFVVINGGEVSDVEQPGDYNSDYNNDFYN